MKISIDVKIILETDTPLSEFDEHFLEVMKSKFGENTEVLPTFGRGEYVLVLKDKI